ncbi:glycosyltransferase involved in cell wall biosynthesis [Elusimicrobium posterum]|uniref:glycosyltransferase n=1 Tax=Elusimicrobium posterum TaxID=3116653 RepID=UPI003C745494
MFKPLVVIAIYNHGKTLAQVVNGVREYYKDILVVNDGSTDETQEVINSLNVDSITHEKNMGKGVAIRNGAAFADKNGYSHILTIDADAQHYPSDLPAIANAAEANPNAIIIGKRDFNTDNVPGSSRFGRKFSAFWAKVQTSKTIVDIQSGMRAYPVALFKCIDFKETRYSFEMEVVIRAIWSGFDVEEVPISVFYPVRAERVSHFGLIKDNLLITILNTRLTIRSMIPFPHKKYEETEEGQMVKLSPFTAIMEQLRSKKNPFLLGISAAWSMFWGTMIIPGRGICLLLGIGWFNLNRPVALTVNKLAWPPFVPALCIEVGHYMRYGEWLTQFNFKTLGYQAPQRIWEWFLGSLAVAPVLAVVMGLLVYLIGIIIRTGLTYGKKP